MKTYSPAISREIKRIYFDTDVSMKSVSKVCAESCSFCCHQNIRVHNYEGAYIEKFIIDDMPIEDKATVKNNLIYWLKYFDSNTPNGRILNEHDILQFEKQITIDRIPCAFLVNDRCSIYKVRPLVCRVHSVNDSPELCKQDPHRNGDMRGIKIRNLKFNEISKASDMFGIRLLAYAAQETLGINHTCKPIGFNVVPTLRSIT